MLYNNPITSLGQKLGKKIQILNTTDTENRGDSNVPRSNFVTDSFQYGKRHCEFQVDSNGKRHCKLRHLAQVFNVEGIEGMSKLNMVKVFNMVKGIVVCESRIVDNNAKTSTAEANTAEANTARAKSVCFCKLTWHCEEFNVFLSCGKTR